jgi:hypothetical protein
LTDGSCGSHSLSPLLNRLLPLLTLLSLLLGQQPEPLPDGTPEPVIEYGGDNISYCPEYFIKVGLLPTKTAAIPDEAARIRARWHTTRAAEETAEDVAELVRDAFIREPATISARLLFQLFFFPFFHLLVLFGVTVLNLKTFQLNISHFIPKGKQ